MSLSKRDHATETLLFDRADEPLGIGVEIGTLRWQPNWLDTATPPVRISPKTRVYRGSRSWIRWDAVRRQPSTGSVRLRASCSLHAPYGCGWIPAMVTRRVSSSITKKTRYRLRHASVSTSTVNRSQAARPSQCACKNAFHGVRRARSGAGSIPWSCRIRLTVFRAMSWPRFASAQLPPPLDTAPLIRQPEAELTGLRVLNLAGNRIEDLWPLAGVTALERLNLSDNRIADLWPLAGRMELNGLEVLRLDGNRVADVQALAPMTRLANLGLAGNPIADLWAAGGARPVASARPLGQRRRGRVGAAAAGEAALGVARPGNGMGAARRARAGAVSAWKAGEAGERRGSRLGLGTGARDDGRSSGARRRGPRAAAALRITG